MLININLYEAKYNQGDIWICLFKAIKGSLLLCIAIVIIMQLLSLRPAMADDVIKAEEWFNNLTTYQAKFTQTASDGSHKTGQFSLKRPHFSRFDYDDPDPLTLITTKAWLHVDEADRRQVTSYPINETPLALILNERVQLREAEVETKSEIRDGIILITLEQHSGLAAGKVVLEFSQDPFELRRWLITDANGITTTIFLSEPKKGITLSPRLFVPTNYPAQN
jgi:outer membrane lipoprotein-sorting protein